MNDGLERCGSKLVVEVVVIAHVQEARRAVRLDDLAPRARARVGRPSRSGTLGVRHEARALLLTGIDRERQRTPRCLGVGAVA